MRMRFFGASGRKAMLAAVGLLALFAAGCSLIEGDDNSDGGSAVAGIGDPSVVRAQSVVFRNELGPLAQRNLVPTSSREIRAQIQLVGVSPGMKVTARWFQLGIANVPPEGGEISSSDVILDANSISVQAETFLNFTLTSGPDGFPSDTWLLRVYVNDQLVRTSGFVVATVSQATAPQPTATAQPPAEPTPISYTVVAGDALQMIAQRFLPEGEALEAYLIRIAELNEIATTSQLQIGQVLQIPGTP